MDDVTARLECLKIARPDKIDNPDTDLIVKRAQAFYDFAMQGAKAPKPEVKADTVTPVAPAIKPVIRPGTPLKAP